MASLFDGMKKVAQVTKEEERKKREEKQKEEMEIARQKRERKEQEERSAAEEAKRRADFAKKVKVALTKIMKAYPHMNGEYIKEDDVEIVRDNEGNIMGMVGDLAFVSNSQGSITFSSKPKILDWSFGPPHDEVYTCIYLQYEVAAKLGMFRTFNFRTEDVYERKTTVCERADYPPKQEQIDAVYDSLKYGQAEKALAVMRTKNTKR